MPTPKIGLFFACAACLGTTILARASDPPLIPPMAPANTPSIVAPGDHRTPRFSIECAAPAKLQLQIVSGTGTVISTIDILTPEKGHIAVYADKPLRSDFQISGNASDIPETYTLNGHVSFQMMAADKVVLKLDAEHIVIKKMNSRANTPVAADK